MAFIPVRIKPLTWVDVETSDLDPDNGDILEIAIIRQNLDGSETVYESKIQMARPENAHPKALEVNGYTEEKWAGARPAAVVMQEIHDIKLLQDCILAGHNVGFDAGFINKTYKRLGIKARVDYHLYDTVTLALEHLGAWVDSVSLVPVCIALGLSTDGAHGAMADVRMAMAVKKVLTTATPEQRSAWATEVPARLAAWGPSAPVLRSSISAGGSFPLRVG